MPASRCRCGEYKRYISLFLKTARHVFLVLKKSGSSGLVSGSFLGRLQTRNLSHPSPLVGGFPSQWVGRESIIHGTPPQGQRIVIILGRLHHLPAYPAGP